MPQVKSPSELPLYQCHKKVNGAKITEIKLKTILLVFLAILLSACSSPGKTEKLKLNIEISDSIAYEGYYKLNTYWVDEKNNKIQKLIMDGVNKKSLTGAITRAKTNNNGVVESATIYRLDKNKIIIKNGAQFREELSKIGDSKATFIMKTGLSVRLNEKLVIPPNVILDCTSPDCSISGSEENTFLRDIMPKP